MMVTILTMTGARSARWIPAMVTVKLSQGEVCDLGPDIEDCQLRALLGGYRNFAANGVAGVQQRAPVSRQTRST